MEDFEVKQIAIDSFRHTLIGNLLLPDDVGYHEARSVWNGMIDRKPAMIVQCENANDVISSINYARDSHLTISVKGGGHGVAGKAVCENGLMLDMSRMNKVTVNAESRIATVGPGSTLGDMDKETEKYGLFTSGGIVSTTGIAGLTLGGGIGYLARKFGLTLDNLLSAKVVTAAGQLLHCDQTENPDLFWALRGGGGNFGVVTSFEYQLHDQNPEILAAQIFYPMEDAPRMMRAYRDLMAQAPDELAGYALVLNLPPVEPFPPELQGTPAFFLLACYSGDHNEGRKLLEPLQELGNPILAVISPMPYVDLQQNFDAGVPKGQRYYWKHHMFQEISDEAIKTFLDFAGNIKGPFTLVGFEPLGGAIARVNAEDTAFIGRDASFALGIWTGWADPGEDEEIIAWARDFHQAMEPLATGRAYSNYLDHDDEAITQAAYGRNYQRLQSIKAKYDSDNFFSQNFNIKPTI
ncbi:MAG: FAD-binding oxidoreductase [Bacteroidetes bacterium]|nr:MAG: FAD-binding oxidoreductase [Bacteroidota bacterium]